MGVVLSRGGGPWNIALLYLWFWYTAHSLPWCADWPQPWDHQDQLSDHGQKLLKYQIASLSNLMISVVSCSAGELTSLGGVNPGTRKELTGIWDHVRVSQWSLHWTDVSVGLWGAVQILGRSLKQYDQPHCALLPGKAWHSLWHLNCTNSDSYEFYL